MCILSMKMGMLLLLGIVTIQSDTMDTEVQGMDVYS